MLNATISERQTNNIRQLYGYKAIVCGYFKEKGAISIDRAGLVSGHHGQGVRTHVCEQINVVTV